MTTKAQQRAINENWSIFQLKGIMSQTASLKFHAPYLKEYIKRINHEAEDAIAEIKRIQKARKRK